MLREWRQRCESDSVKRKITEMTFPQSRIESILNCLLIGNGSFIYILVSRKLTDQIEEGKPK